MAKNKIVYLLIIVTVVFLLSFRIIKPNRSDKIALLVDAEQKFTAGSEVVLTFTGLKEENKSILLIKSSYATTLLEPEGNIFKMPEFITAKSGVAFWQLLIDGEEKTKGSFEIFSQEQASGIETYLGPRTVSAGGENYTMMVNVPHDRFDNPATDSTEVIVKFQFLDKIDTTTLFTNNFIAFKKIKAPEKRGKILISATCNEVFTKEFETDVYAALPKDFLISYTRNHEYADGNQLTVLQTSAIKDKFGNNVNDGTSVTFIIKTVNGTVLKTYGNTINGVAQTKVLCPEHPDLYIVKAYVTGIAESNTLNINYKSSITEINYKLSKDKKAITIGPLKSFMGQLVPNGTTVSLTIRDKEGKEYNTIKEYTVEGEAVLILPKELHNKTYSFEIDVMGMKQKTGLIDL